MRINPSRCNASGSVVVGGWLSQQVWVAQRARPSSNRQTFSQAVWRRLTKDEQAEPSRGSAPLVQRANVPGGMGASWQVQAPASELPSLLTPTCSTIMRVVGLPRALSWRKWSNKTLTRDQSVQSRLVS
jgi:hypothetical protein